MKKILLIEDNQDVRENIADLLELANYNVATSKNGILGIKKARQFEPDIIICDIMMPELDGYGVLDLLSKDVKTACIPFIFMSAKSESSDIRMGMNMGADDYLTKPFEDVELFDAIKAKEPFRKSVHK
jgi:DNA-binding response OmpR family regulator